MLVRYLYFSRNIVAKCDIRQNTLIRRRGTTYAPWRYVAGPVLRTVWQRAVQTWAASRGVAPRSCVSRASAPALCWRTTASRRESSPSLAWRSPSRRAAARPAPRPTRTRHLEDRTVTRTHGQRRHPGEHAEADPPADRRALAVDTALHLGQFSLGAIPQRTWLNTSTL